MEIRSSKELHLSKVGDVMVKANHHIATGGEGSVYRVPGHPLAAKLYTDHKRMEREGLVDKFRLLSALKHPYLVAPLGGVTSSSGRPLGYYMGMVEKAEQLLPLFDTGVQQSLGWGVEQTRQLAERMRTVMLHAHSHDAVMCDPNVLNWAVILKGENGQPEPRAFDVDAWQIGQWRGNYVASNIRDWQVQGFSEETDRFAMACLLFELFTGIHPYMGRLQGYTPSPEAERLKPATPGDNMKVVHRIYDRASVFSPEARLPRAVRPLDDIPPKLLAWFEATLQHGKRGDMPSPLDLGKVATMAAVMRTVATGATGMLVYNKLLDGGSDPVIRIFPCGVALRQSKTLVDLKSLQTIATASSLQCEVVQQDNYWIVADWEGDEKPVFKMIHRHSLDSRPVAYIQEIVKVFRYENRLFGVTNQHLIELAPTFVGNTVMPTAETRTENGDSTRWFSGLGITDAMGSKILLLPFEENGFLKLRVAELDGLTPALALAGHRFVAVFGSDRNGQYRKVELTFDADYRAYSAWSGPVEQAKLNVAMPTKGRPVVLMILDDGELSIYRPDSQTLDKVVDSKIGTDMTLASWGDKVLMITEGGVWTVKKS